MVRSTMHKLYDVNFGFDEPSCIFSFLVMMLTLEPPSRSTSSIKSFPTWTYIIVILWSMAIEATTNSSNAGFDGTWLSMQHLISSITHNNCPKFKVYLVSETCLLISFKISLKVFFVVTYSRITSYWFTSPIWLFSTNWATIVLSGSLA
jgi:hypothetical protein